MKKIALFLSILCVCLALLAGCGGETGSIEGYVYVDNSKGVSARTLAVQPKLVVNSSVVSGATVVLNNGFVTTTDSNGRFVFYNVNPGTYTLTISHPDFRDNLKKTVIVRAGQKTSVDSSLGVEKNYYINIGVDDYINNDVVDDLKGPANDANTMRDALCRFNTDVQPTVLTGQEATTNRILSEISNVAQEMSYDDYLVLTFSGHGGADFIAPADFDGTYNTVITDMDLKNALSEVPNPSHVIVILDVCYAGSFINGRGVTQAKAPVVPKALKGTGITVLAASRDNEESFENDDTGDDMGIFTRFLSEGLTSAKELADANNNREITASELFNYAKAETISATEELQNQYPWVTVQNPVAQFGSNPIVMLRY